MAINEIIGRLTSGELPVDFNWNGDLYEGIDVIREIRTEPTPQEASRVTIISECLRDGLHGVGVQPLTNQRTEYVGKLVNFGINWTTVGIFSGVDNKVDRNVKTLLANMQDRYPEVNPIVLAPATEAALKWVVECKKINRNLAAIAFMGTSPSRLLVEEWTREAVLDKLGWLIRSLCDEGITVIGATEHTTQTPPDFLRKIIETEVAAGAKYFCIADTIGIARPVGVSRIVHYVKNVLQEMGRPEVQIDWHGHRDTGNEIGNAMAAIAAGANRIHAVSGGIGERAGNVSLETLVINLNQIMHEAGLVVPWKVEKLSDLVESYYQMIRLPIPEHGPMGKRAFTTSLGIHTSAMLKAVMLAEEAEKMGNRKLANALHSMSRTVYSAIDPESVGRSHETRISPNSGSSTVRRVALELELDPTLVTDEKILFLLRMAKDLGKELTLDEVKRMLTNGH